MEYASITQNVKKILAETPAFNSYGEKITVIAATKTRTAEEINVAVTAGITDVGENKAQEFRDKFGLVTAKNYHFFGRLQKNKVKYLIGKACLIHSVDSFDLAEEISKQSQKAGVVTNILLEVNLGEESKGGIPFEELQKTYASVKTLPSVCVKGLMAVLPNVEEINLLRQNCLQMRKTYDIMKQTDENFTVLSMGMSKDFRLAIECGSNTVRIGESIFGKRIYTEN